MSHSILTKSNRASCNSSLRATADILLISMGLGTGPWLFNSTLQCAFSSPFLPYLLSPLIIVSGSDLVRAGAAVNTKKDPRDHPEGALDLPGLIPKVHTVFPRLTPRMPSSPHLHCWICWRGAGPHLLLVQLPSLASAALTTPGRWPAATSRGSCWGSAFILLLPHDHLVPQTSAPTAWGNAPSLIPHPETGHISSLKVITWEKVTKSKLHTERYLHIFHLCP